MKIWNSKFGTNIHFDFEIKFRTLFEVNFGKLDIVLKLGKSKVQCFK